MLELDLGYKTDGYSLSSKNRATDFMLCFEIPLHMNLEPTVHMLDCSIKYDRFDIRKNVVCASLHKYLIYRPIIEASIPLYRP